MMMELYRLLMDGITMNKLTGGISGSTITRLMKLA